MDFKNVKTNLIKIITGLVVIGEIGCAQTKKKKNLFPVGNGYLANIASVTALKNVTHIQKEQYQLGIDTNTGITTIGLNPLTNNDIQSLINGTYTFPLTTLKAADTNHDKIIGEKEANIYTAKTIEKTLKQKF